MAIDPALKGGTFDLLLLKLISEKDRYGQELSDMLIELSNGEVGLVGATLYPHLSKMEKKGFIKRYSNPGSRGRDRVMYKITEEGRKHLGFRVEEWNTWTGIVNLVLAR